MTLADRVKNLIPFLRSPRRLPPPIVRGLHPTRNPAAVWKRQGDDNLVVIDLPRPAGLSLLKVVARLTGEPETHRTELSDEMASFVWELCDGRNNVGDICRAVSTEYKLGERQTEVSVLQFLNMLRTRHLVGIPERDQIAIKGTVDSDKRAASMVPRTGQEAGHGDSHYRSKSGGRSKRGRSRRH